MSKSMALQIVEMELFLTGEMLLQVKSISPRNISRTVKIVRAEVQKYVKKKKMNLSRKTTLDVERQIIFSLMVRLDLPDDVCVALEEVLDRYLV